MIGISPAIFTPHKSNGHADNHNIQSELDRAKTASRKLQGKLEQAEIKLAKAEAELLDLRMENKLIKASVIDYDLQSHDPTAPPPYQASTDGSVHNSSSSSSHTTDNNLDLDHDRIDAISCSDSSYRLAVSCGLRRGTVQAEVYDNGGSSSTTEAQFTFTDSALEILDRKD